MQVGTHRSWWHQAASYKCFWLTFSAGRPQPRSRELKPGISLLELARNTLAGVNSTSQSMIWSCCGQDFTNTDQRRCHKSIHVAAGTWAPEPSEKIPKAAEEALQRHRMAKVPRTRPEPPKAPLRRARALQLRILNPFLGIPGPQPVNRPAQSIRTKCTATPSEVEVKAKTSGDAGFAERPASQGSRPTSCQSLQMSGEIVEGEEVPRTQTSPAARPAIPIRCQLGVFNAGEEERQRLGHERRLMYAWSSSSKTHALGSKDITTRKIAPASTANLTFRRRSATQWHEKFEKGASDSSADPNKPSVPSPAGLEMRDLANFTNDEDAFYGKSPNPATASTKSRYLSVRKRQRLPDSNSDSDTSANGSERGSSPAHAKATREGSDKDVPSQVNAPREASARTITRSGRPKKKMARRVRFADELGGELEKIQLFRTTVDWTAARPLRRGCMVR